MLGNNKDYAAKQIEQGTIIIKEGSEVENLVLVKSGEVACVTLANDRLVPVGFIQGAGLISEESVFSETKASSYTAVAMTNATIVEIPKGDIEKVLDSSSDWIRRLLKDMSDKINNTSDVLAEHRIIDDRFNAGKPFTSEEEAMIRNSLNPKTKD